MAIEQDCSEHDPLAAGECTGFTDPNECELNLTDEYMMEFLELYGFPVQVYLCTFFDPQPVFGEDPLKKYEIPPIDVMGMWEPYAKDQTMGSHERLSTDEPLIMYLHKNSLMLSIRCALIEAGLISDDDTLNNPTDQTKLERHRAELQEQDIIYIPKTKIHFEIDGIKDPVVHRHLLNQYYYEVYMRPRLVAGEDLGVMQPVTDADAIREQHEFEIQSEADVILF